MPGYLIYNFVLHNNRSHFYALPHDYHHDCAEHIHYVLDQHEHEVCYFFGS